MHQLLIHRRIRLKETQVGKKMGSRLFHGDLLEMRHHHFDSETIENDRENGRRTKQQQMLVLLVHIRWVPSVSFRFLDFTWFRTDLSELAQLSERSESRLHTFGKYQKRTAQKPATATQWTGTGIYVEKPASNNTNCIQSNWNGKSGILQIASNRNKHMLIWAKRNAELNTTQQQKWERNEKEMAYCILNGIMLIVGRTGNIVERNLLPSLSLSHALSLSLL